MNESALATTAAALQQMVDAAPFLHEFGFRVVDIGPGTCTLEVPFRPHYERPGGVIPGFIYMAAADVVAWLALYTLFGDGAEFSVTTDMRTAFLSGLRGEPFLCTGRIAGAGEQLYFCTVDSRDKRGKLLAHHAVTYIAPVAKAPPAM